MCLIYVLSQELIEVQKDLTYQKKPRKLLIDKTLKNKMILLVKVLCRNQKFEEVTWEREDDMRMNYIPSYFKYFRICINCYSSRSC